MAKKSRTKTKKRAKMAYPGMLGDGTEEQIRAAWQPEGAYQEERSGGGLRQTTVQEIVSASKNHPRQLSPRCSMIRRAGRDIDALSRGSRACAIGLPKASEWVCAEILLRRAWKD